MDDLIYRALARHLDDMPGGFPPASSGVELRILRRLFDPEEAALAVHLTLLAEPPRVIARRAGLDVGEVSSRLEAMARKGLIYQSGSGPGDRCKYMALQFVIGIWEFQVNRLNPELIRDVNEYMEEFLEAGGWKSLPQLRTIPVGRSLHGGARALPYERAEELIRGVKRGLVAPCICRRERAIMGEGCGRLGEACLVFGGAVDIYRRNGVGRMIGRDEALDILKEAERQGLVLQPMNSRDAVNICCCCGCCCGVLRNLKKQPRPADFFSSAFRVAADPSRCRGCGLCLDRCQMEALALVEGRVVLDRDRCLGCGLCAVSCPAGALRLVRKPENEQKKVPWRSEAMFLQLARKRGRMDLVKAAGILAGSARDRLLTWKRKSG
ncbi:MAG: 4Fe-4S dicluster domain-containing protein [Pseudomonadota bacterium]